MTAPTTSPIPISDTDGDANSVSDLLTPGPNSPDPNEAGETDEQLINFGGQGLDLRPAEAIHSPTISATLPSQSQFDLGISMIGSLITMGTIPTTYTPLAAISLLVAGVGEASTATEVYKESQAQQDPFDPNYTQVYTPIVVTPPALPAITPNATLTATFVAKFQNDAMAADKAGLNAASDADAVYVSQNRLFSAYQQGDLASVMLQNTALTKFEAALATDTTAQGNAYAALETDMKLVGFDLTATTAGLASFVNTLKTQGLTALPQEEQAIIKTYLPNAADQQAILSEMTSVSQPNVPLSFTGALNMGSSTLQSVGIGLSVPPLTNNAVPPLSGPGPFANLPAGDNFSITDTSTAQIATTAGTPYSGPVTGLQNELVLITSDNLNLTATTPNVFIHSGSGDDALNVSQANGNNVLDGGAGSNFLTGGTGTDTFFVDDRNPTADIWSTVVKFHAGDAATIWGVTPQDFALSWVDGQGAAGFTGVTLHATASGKPTASLTLAGFTQADMASGKLSVSFGADPVSGSPYMYVHGNS